MAESFEGTLSKQDLREVIRTVRALGNIEERLNLLTVVVSSLVRRLPDDVDWADVSRQIDQDTAWLSKMTLAPSYVDGEDKSTGTDQ